MEITYGMRTGEKKGIIHGSYWKRCMEGSKEESRYEWENNTKCPMGCGKMCTMRHVVTGDCKGCEEEEKGKSKRVEIMAAVNKIDSIIWTKWDINEKKRAQKEGKTTNNREEVRGKEWIQQLQNAKKATIGKGEE